jgi:hypothetical protein
MKGPLCINPPHFNPLSRVNGILGMNRGHVISGTWAISFDGRSASARSEIGPPIAILSQTECPSAKMAIEKRIQLPFWHKLNAIQTNCHLPYTVGVKLHVGRFRTLVQSTRSNARGDLRLVVKMQILHGKSPETQI